MKMHERSVGKVWFQWGMYSKSIGFGIYLSTIQCSLDLLFFYIQVEFPMSERRMVKIIEKKKNA